MFISDTEKTPIPVTDNIDEALVFSAKYDNQQTKLGYWTAYTGYKLQIKNI